MKNFILEKFILKKIIFTITFFLLSIVFSNKTTFADLKGYQIIKKLYTQGGIFKPINTLVIKFLVKIKPAKEDAKSEDDLIDYFKGKMFFKAPNKIRTEFVFIENGVLKDSEKFTKIRNGIYQGLYRFDFDTPLKWGNDPQIPSINLPFNLQEYPYYVKRVYTLIAEEEYKNKRVYVVGITNKLDPQKAIIKVWIDKKNYLPLKVEKTIQKNGKTIKQTFIYSDIGKLSDGRLFPTKILVYQNGKLNIAIYYLAITINQPLSDKLFNINISPTPSNIPKFP